MMSLKRLVGATYQKYLEMCVTTYQKTKNSQTNSRILEE